MAKAIIIIDDDDAQAQGSLSVQETLIKSATKN